MTNRGHLPALQSAARLAWALLLFASLPLGHAQPADAAKPDASIASEKIDTDGRFRKRHESFLARGKEGPIGVLFLGDSITSGWSKAPDVWKTHYEPYQPANFGIGGDQTQHVIWRIENGELDGISPKVTVLLIGTNNTAVHNADEIAAATRKIVRLIRMKLPQTKVLLLAVFPRGASRDKDGKLLDDGVARMATIGGVNAQLAALDDGKNIRFLDINSRFLDASSKIPESVMPDQLHPSPAGYKIWAEAMQPTLDLMMK